jgi:4-azaleucine resistance transporter AzlC
VTTVEASTPAVRGEIGEAFVDSLPVAAAMVPIGIAFGVLLVHSGLAWWWAPVFNGLILAGSLEFLVVGLVHAHVALVTIAVTTLLVNSRHVFYCLTFPLHRVRGRLPRFYARFALIDEAYALTVRPQAQLYSSRRIVSTQVFLQLYWVAGGLIGALIGGALPSALNGIDFALTALFVILAIDAIKAGRDARGPVAAGGCAVAAYLVAPGQMLVVAMGMYVAVLLVLSRRDREEHSRA